MWVSSVSCYCIVRVVILYPVLVGVICCLLKRPLAGRDVSTSRYCLRHDCLLMTEVNKGLTENVKWAGLSAAPKTL